MPESGDGASFATGRSQLKYVMSFMGEFPLALLGSGIRDPRIPEELGALLRDRDRAMEAFFDLQDLLLLEIGKSVVTMPASYRDVPREELMPPDAERYKAAAAALREASKQS